MDENSEMRDELVIRSTDSWQSGEADYSEKIERQDQAASWESEKGESFVWASANEIDQLKSRWNSIQIGFVDNPRSCVEKADALVKEILERIEKAVSDQRSILDGQQNQHEEISTEDFRIALQNYRSFLYRLLTV